MEFDEVVQFGTALELDLVNITPSSDIEIKEPGWYNFSWEVYVAGYDSAFALFFDDGGGPAIIPGSNYGAMSHDGKYHGQAIAYLAEVGTLTLNRYDDLLLRLEILNKIGGGTEVVGASIVITKLR